MSTSLFAWMASHGSLALFGLLVIAIVGLPVPGETLLLAAGVLVGRRTLEAAPVYAAAIVGATLGITISYYLGRAAGVTVVRRYGRHLHIETEDLDEIRTLFQHSGKWGLMFGYFVPGVRHFTALIAGAANLDLVTFATFAYTGALLWSVTFITLGLYVGDRWQTIADTIHTYGWELGLVVLIACVALLVHRHMQRHK